MKKIFSTLLILLNITLFAQGKLKQYSILLDSNAHIYRYEDSNMFKKWEHFKVGIKYRNQEYIFVIDSIVKIVPNKPISFHDFCQKEPTIHKSAYVFYVYLKNSIKSLSFIKYDLKKKAYYAYYTKFFAARIYNSNKLIHIEESGLMGDVYYNKTKISVKDSIAKRPKVPIDYEPSILISADNTDCCKKLEWVNYSGWIKIHMIYMENIGVIHIYDLGGHGKGYSSVLSHIDNIPLMSYKKLVCKCKNNTN